MKVMVLTNKHWNVVLFIMVRKSFTGKSLRRKIWMIDECVKKKGIYKMFIRKVLLQVSFKILCNIIVSKVNNENS